MIHALGVRVQSQEVRVVVVGKATSRVCHIPRRKNNAFRQIQLSHLGDNFSDTSLGKARHKVILLPFPVLRLPYNLLFMGSCDFNIFCWEMKC